MIVTKCVLVVFEEILMFKQDDTRAW